MNAPCSIGIRYSALAAVAVWCGAAACDGTVVNLGRARTGSATGGDAAGGNSTGSSQASSAGRSSSVAAGSSGEAGGASSGGSATSQAGSATEPIFVQVRRVAALASSYEDDNPTLTSDLTELYFSSKNRPGGKGNVDVWVAKRDSADSEFAEPEPVLSVSTVGIDNSPAVSADGLTLWVGFAPAADGLGGYDIMQATRASRSEDFGMPVLIQELSSSKDDIPRPLGHGNLTMPLASRRDNDMYMTYLATRPSVTAAFGTPVLKNELIVPGANVSDAFLTEDGLTLYFARAVDSKSNLFVARRTTVSSPFSSAIPLSTLNTEYDDRDPFLTPDGKHIYFSSDRDNPGTLNIYEADLAE